jgi:hypothetical protein
MKLLKVFSLSFVLFFALAQSASAQTSANAKPASASKTAHVSTKSNTAPTSAKVENATTTPTSTSGTKVKHKSKHHRKAKKMKEAGK